MTADHHFDVVVIGAGPSGAIASALLANRGHSVLVLERQTFPRFSIGESLLPQCMEFIAEAGMLNAVEKAGFQRKDGALFLRDGRYSGFDFSENFSGGWEYTFQVPRAEFDTILANEAAASGADVRYRHEITRVDLGGSKPAVTCRLPDGTLDRFTTDFILDASGFGRVLPRLLDLEAPSGFPVRHSLFTHVQDGMKAGQYDRNRILITIHPSNRAVWYWLIPFSNNRSSVGVVGEPVYFEDSGFRDVGDLRTIVDQTPELGALLSNADWDRPANVIRGYSANVKTLATRQYALLGNAGEFLDPVFSSGVTIAMYSASMAARLVSRQLRGGEIDWTTEYAHPLGVGVRTFRSFVNAWYDGRFQDIIFHEKQSAGIRKMICSILAGYAWDENNPFVREPERRIHALWQHCSQAAVRT